METFYTRVLDWYKEGYRSIANNVLKWDRPKLAPIRRVLKKAGIEYRNSNNSAGASIYVKEEDYQRAMELTKHLPRHWYQEVSE